MSNLYALLIGIDFYFPNLLPGGGSYPSLGGCVRDVRHVEEYFKTRLELPPSRILKLTATNTGGSKPAEPAGQLPTYANMVAKFKELTATAKSGDRVYIHYSGHGGRAKTIFPDLKGPLGLDEALVPTDIGNSEARYLRDVELAYLIKEMVDKDLIVTLVFDSCHSGGVTRKMATPRGIAAIDTTERPKKSLVAPVPALIAGWKGQSGGTTRAAKPASGWLLEPQGYTLFAACRANESAFEYPFNGKESNGALTYWLLDGLRKAGPNVSYKTIYDGIVAKVHGQFTEQTPQLQGEGNRALFRSDEIKPYFAVGVMNVDGNHVELAAGEAHRVQIGSQFAIYPQATLDFSTEQGRLAIVEVDKLLPDGVSSRAKVVQKLISTPILQGAQAVLLNNVDLRLQRNVLVDIKKAALRKQVTAAIVAGGKGFIKAARPGDPLDFQVVVDKQGNYLLLDPADDVLPNIEPALSVADETAIQKLVNRLIHLAKFRNVADLEAPDAGASRQSLRVELVKISGTPGTVFRPGDQVQLKITNLQEPNPDNINDPERVLNVTVFNLGSDWGISQVYPQRAGIFEPVNPQLSIELTFEAYLPEGAIKDTGQFKIFATRATTSFRWLELPPLDKPDTRSAASRSAVTDPLEQMLAQITGDAISTRALRLTSDRKDVGWTVAQVEFHVEK